MTATLTMTQLVSLDGVAELDDGWLTAAGPAAQAAFAESMASEQALLLGHRSYDEFSAYWPDQTSRDDDTGRMARHLAQVPKYTVANSPLTVRWGGTTVLDGDPVDAVRALKHRLDGTIVLNGSITLVRTLLAAGLVDEFRTYIVPALAGRGRTLISGKGPGQPLTLVGSSVLDGGIVRLIHRAAGLD